MNVVQMPNQEPDLVIEFSDFWGMYPRRVAKKDARRAWDKIPQKFHTEILTAIFEWSRIWKDENREDKQIPHAATWLNGERWEDEFPSWHHPYTPKQAAKDRHQAKTEDKDRKLMPAHIREAMNKIRAQS